MSSKVKYLIIGGGVTGLSFANYIDSDNYLILEKESEVGGYCRTIRKNDFIWDYAGHFFHFANEDIKKMFLDEIPTEELVHKKKNTKIYYKRNMIEYPFQKNIHELEKDDFIDCLYHLFEKEEKLEYKNFEEMLYGKFGKGITERFLKPYNEKLYACDLNELEASSMGRFFPYADVKDIILNMKKKDNSSYNKYFMYPKKGAKVFIDVLLNKIPSEKIKLNTKVEKIDIKNKFIETNNEKIEFEYLINTMPFDKLLNILGEDNKDYTSNKVLVLNLGFNKKSKEKDIHWIYYPEKEINFYRVGFYDNILDSKKASLYVEIGYKKDEKIDINGELEKTIINLEKVGLIDSSYKLEAYSSIIMNPAYVHISKKATEGFKNKSEELMKKNVFSIGRYGGWKYCSIEDNVIEAKELADKIEKEKE